MAQETILIVDDSPEISRVLDEYMLAPLGYRVIHATDGQSGLNTALTRKPDLIMSDIQMPRLNGMEMLTALRQTDCQIPIIFMTMHGSESVAVEAFRLGVRDYLMKPFTPDEVKQAVDRALQETRLAREKEELTRNLIASEAIRQTAVTLSHYVNNRLMVLSGGLALLQETLQEELPDHPTLSKIMRDSRISADQIGAIIRVLQRVTKIQQTHYGGQVHMIDIEAALREELGQK